VVHSDKDRKASSMYIAPAPVNGRSSPYPYSAIVSSQKFKLSVTMKVAIALLRFFRGVLLIRRKSSTVADSAVLGGQPMVILSNLPQPRTADAASLAREWIKDGKS
jgi:hypothetical protein